MSYPFKNLVFEGGGVKGIAYVGALQVLEEQGISKQIARVGGTSAGAINALMMASGFSISKTRKILYDLDFNDFKDDSWGALRDLKRLGEKFGWHKGKRLKEWLGELLAMQGLSKTITFDGLLKATGKGLYVYATNVSTHFGEVYSPEHTPRMRVVDAVRRSMSIPLYFAAVRDDRDDVFVDGGVLNNYPVKLFDRIKYIDTAPHIRRTKYYNSENRKLKLGPRNKRCYAYNKETLGFRLDSAKEIAVFRDGDTPKSSDIDNLMDYTFELVKTLVDAQDSQHLHSDDWHRTIYIDSLGVGTAEFDLGDKKKRALVKSGKKSTAAYLQWWSDTGSDLAINHPQASD
jgi:NTE family protein